MCADKTNPSIFYFVVSALRHLLQSQLIVDYIILEDNKKILIFNRYIFIHKLPSRRLQTYKHRCAMGKLRFYRHFVLTVNNLFK